MNRLTPTDVLVAESERLRHALRRAARRLSEFTDELIQESRRDRKEDPGERRKTTGP